MAKKIKPTAAQKAKTEAEKAEVIENEVISAPESQTSSVEAHTVPKKKDTASKHVRTRTRGTRYLKAVSTLGPTKNTGLNLIDAINGVKKVAFAHMKESVELHLNVFEVGLRGETSLPFSTGKTTKVVVADDELLEKLEKGIVDFDLLVTTPAFMPKLTKFAKLLGPRGLMPNPKAGTLGNNVEELVNKFSGSTVRYKTEPKAPIIHVILGKVDDTQEHLAANAEAYMAAIGKKNIKSVFITSTMSPSIKVQF